MSLGVCRLCVCLCVQLQHVIAGCFSFLILVVRSLLSFSVSVLPPFKMWNFICILITSSNVLKIICIYLFLNSFRSLSPSLTRSLSCSISLSLSRLLSVASLHTCSIDSMVRFVRGAVFFFYSGLSFSSLFHCVI